MTKTTPQPEENAKHITIEELNAFLKKNMGKEIKDDYSGLPSHRTGPALPERIIDRIFH